MTAHPFTRALYNRLPGVYRDADTAGQLLAYLSLLGDEAGAIADIADRLDTATPAELAAFPRDPVVMWSPSILAGGDIPTRLLPSGASAYAGATITSTTANPYRGEYSLAVTSTADQIQGVTFTPPLNQGVPVGKVVRCTAWGRVPAGAPPLNVQVEGQALRVGSDEQFAAGLGAMWHTLGEDWSQIHTQEWTFNAAWVTDFRPAMRIVTTTPTAGVTFCVDDLAVSWQIVTDPTTSDLVDPARANEAWLPWLAQLVGARSNNRLTVPDQRSAIRGAVGGWASGTRQAIAAAASAALVGDRYVNVTDHYGGNPWVLGVSTTEAGTPSAAAVIAAITEAGAKPAGFTLTHTFYLPAWDTIEAQLPTWDAIEAVGTWARISSVV